MNAHQRRKARRAARWALQPYQREALAGLQRNARQCVRNSDLLQLAQRRTRPFPRAVVVHLSTPGGQWAGDLSMLSTRFDKIFAGPGPHGRFIYLSSAECKSPDTKLNFHPAFFDD